ncbi:hypothetical protein DL89DRAFT_10193 [Linderina pennispora]|uniref:Uncharacterized protein n=1 Tax=Linderina pennispora TaxID=61395 RepID=A0A1Y1WL87_9FUNG|nr:uncharacterized protein DL89DRAFT_10193 [Linderina pennispora]ORX74125.1 hypothetical protein DL89DRAFT_10193 [Linderina pennispora]
MSSASSPWLHVLPNTFLKIRRTSRSCSGQTECKSGGFSNSSKNDSRFDECKMICRLQMYDLMDRYRSRAVKLSWSLPPKYLRLLGSVRLPLRCFGGFRLSNRLCKRAVHFWNSGYSEMSLALCCSRDVLGLWAVADLPWKLDAGNGRSAYYSQLLSVP